MQLASSPRKVPHETQLKPFFAFDETIFRLPLLNPSFSADDQWATGTGGEATKKQ
jgi:hypothetical protein